MTPTHNPVNQLKFATPETARSHGHTMSRFTDVKNIGGFMAMKRVQKETLLADRSIRKAIIRRTQSRNSDA